MLVPEFLVRLHGSARRQRTGEVIVGPGILPSREGLKAKQTNCLPVSKKLMGFN